jgi:hypothetical protein
MGLFVDFQLAVEPVYPRNEGALSNVMYRAVLLSVDGYQ